MLLSMRSQLGLRCMLKSMGRYINGPIFHLKSYAGVAKNGRQILRGEFMLFK